MAYFVTGATGFIGKRLVHKLLEEKRGKIYILTRSGSKKKLKAQLAEWGNSDRIVPITGDLTKKRMGVSSANIKALSGKARCMKINGNEIRPGNVIQHQGGLWAAVKVNAVKPG